jgi:cytochrome c-type biogenesis protein CcmH
MRSIRLIVALTCLLAFTAMPAFASGIGEAIQANLMCQCGCTMVLSTCECGTAEQMRGEIAAMLDKGQTQDDILNFYVGKYGDKVLAAPKAQGFNLSAYITPFAVILAGGGVLGLIVRQWVIRTRAKPVEILLATSAPASPDELRARLDRELSTYD